MIVIVGVIVPHRRGLGRGLPTWTLEHGRGPRRRRRHGRRWRRHRRPGTLVHSGSSGRSMTLSPFLTPLTLRKASQHGHLTLEQAFATLDESRLDDAQGGADVQMDAPTNSAGMFKAA